MALRFTNVLALRLQQEIMGHGLLSQCLNGTNLTLVRNINKHWDPKFKRLRRLKVVKVDLPDFRTDPKTMTKEEIRKEMIKKGMLPIRPWNERTPFLHSSGGVFEPYVPPEGDGKISPISKQGAMQSLTFLGKKSKTMMAVRKIRQYEEDFDVPAFCKVATEIYIKMHELLAKRDKENLIDYVTEKAYSEALHNIERKTIRWAFIKEIELPRVVHARTTHIITKENIFAQLTIRFHTQQTLAIYDRFGRLMHGSEILAKDVLEYVVFEKNISNEYGRWRIHGKIIPDWLPSRDPSKQTYIQEVEAVEISPPEDKSIAKTNSDSIIQKDSHDQTVVSTVS